MSYKELDITIEMPAIGEAYGISVKVDGFEPAFGTAGNTQSFYIPSISWKTYCDELNDDVLHIIHNTWMCGKDLLDMLEQVHKLIETLSR